MCLSRVFRGKEKRETLAKLPVSGYYWKIVSFKDNKYWPEFYSHYPFAVGLNVTQGCSYHRIPEYNAAYHAFRTKKSAEKWRGSCKWVKIVRCIIKKKDLTAIGSQSDFGLCVVATRIWMPKPKT